MASPPSGVSTVADDASSAPLLYNNCIGVAGWDGRPTEAKHSFCSLTERQNRLSSGDCVFSSSLVDSVLHNIRSKTNVGAYEPIPVLAALRSTSSARRRHPLAFVFTLFLPDELFAFSSRAFLQLRACVACVALSLLSNA